MRFRLALPLLLALASTSPGADIDPAGVRGGLVVHLECGDGKQTVALRKNDSFVVFGLDREMKNVEAARAHIRARGLYGKVTADRLAGDTLPLIDNIVNLLVADGATGIDDAEIRRVLAPGGVALVAGRKIAKPVPAENDEWTHYLHGPDNNAVSKDNALSHPYHMQWAGDPVWTRNHNHLNSYSAVVTANGRVFYILDEGPTQSVRYAPTWRLGARDAYNGVVLWKKDIPAWEPHLRRFRSGPVEIPRRLLASGDRVYVTLGYDAPLSILDAATGRVLHTVAGTEKTHEILLVEDVVYAVTGTTEDAKILDKRIVAVSAADGRTILEIATDETRRIMPSTLCADATGLYFQTHDSLVRLDRKTGKVAWKTPRAIELNRKTWAAPTLVVHDDVVLCADGAFGAEKARKKGKGKKAAPAPKPAPATELRWIQTASPTSAEGGELVAFSAKDGKELWRCPAALGYCAPPNLFVIDNLVWVSRVPGINEEDMTEGRDLRTGEVKRRLKTARAFETAHHHRCYRDKATDRFLLLGRTGVEYVDIRTNEIQRHYWIRGTCQYGLMPANGLLYLPGHSCGCYIQSKLSGFWAVASKRKARKAPDTERLLKGEAYGAAGELAAMPDPWPIHRADNGRSGTTKTVVPKDVKEIWSTALTGEITPPVIAGGRVVVAVKDRHVVTALDASDGKPHWSFTAGGPVDSPPTLDTGWAVFGCHDGHVYCLRLADGRLAWKYRAAPEDLRTMAFGQLESVWPVVGSVSIVDGTVYGVAGRSSYLDGGMVLFRLDLATGGEKGRTVLYSRNPETGEQPDELLEDVELPGSLPDILVFEGDHLYLRDRPFDLAGKEQAGRYGHHLYSSAGLLDPHWWHRTIWIWGTRAWGRASGWAIAGKYNPSGRLLVLGPDRVYGYKFAESGSHALFCADKKVVKSDKKLSNNNAAIVKYVTPDKVVYHWSEKIDFAVRGMVKAGDVLFVAGPDHAAEIHFDAKSAATLAAYGADTGKALSRMQFPCQPVFDGMAAADKRLFLSLTNGKVVCYGAK